MISLTTLLFLAAAQAAQPASGRPPASPIVLPGDAAAPAPAPVWLPRGTPVELMVVQEVTTKSHGAGHRFRLRVHRPVEVEGRVLVPAGAIAWGEVLEAEGSGVAGKGGTLAARLLYLEAGGARVPLAGEAAHEGRDGTAETVLGVVGLGLLGLLARGNNAKLKAGEVLEAVVEEDVELAPLGG